MGLLMSGTVGADGKRNGNGGQNCGNEDETRCRHTQKHGDIFIQTARMTVYNGKSSGGHIDDSYCAAHKRNQKRTDQTAFFAVKAEVQGKHDGKKTSRNGCREMNCTAKSEKPFHPEA